MKKENLLPTAIAVVIGIAGLLLLLYAWHLPPFQPAEPTTENAYVRGKVTSIAPQVAGYVAAVEVTDFQEVKTGDVIARIDDRIPRQKLAQAEAQLAAARAAMAKQTGLDKKTVLNVRPAFLIVPASLELKAEQLVAQNLVPAATSSVVPQSIRTLAPISEPRLDAASATAWYLAASPNQIDTIEYAYLEGQQGAYIETRNGFDVDGVEIKCRLDFGAKAIDWRGLYKNPGA